MKTMVTGDTAVMNGSKNEMICCYFLTLAQTESVKTCQKVARITAVYS